MRKNVFSALFLVCALGVTLREASATEPRSFSMTLTVGGDYARTLVFGMDPAGSHGFDAGLDQELSPAGPAGTPARFVGSDTVTRLATDIRRTTDLGHVWVLVLQKDSGKTMTLAWTDPDAAFLSGMGLVLVTPGGTEVDMKALTGMGITASGTYRIILGAGGNDAPVARDDHVYTVPGGATPASIVLPVLANDSDTPGDALSVTSVANPSPASGDVEIADFGAALRYTPGPGFVGAHTFYYTVTDDHLMSLTDTATVTVEVRDQLGASVWHPVSVPAAGSFPLSVTLACPESLSGLRWVQSLPDLGGEWIVDEASLTAAGATLTQVDRQVVVDFGAVVPPGPQTVSYDVYTPAGVSGAGLLSGVIEYQSEPGGAWQEVSLPQTSVALRLPTFSVVDAQTDEGNDGTSNLTVTVHLNEICTEEVTVQYATADGSATVADNDYSFASGILVFDPGMTKQTFTVPVHGDTAYEADENFGVTLSNPVNAEVLRGTGTATIRNDDREPPPGMPDWEAPAGLLNTMTVHGVVLDGEAFVTADGSMLAAFKDDAIRGVAQIFTGPKERRQFQLSVGSNAANEDGLNLKVYDAGSDTVLDITETFDFTADATLGMIFAPVQFTTDNGGGTLPAISVADVSVAEGDAGQSAMEFTVQLDREGASPVTVSYSTVDGTAKVGGQDYDAAGGQLILDPGETTATVTVYVNGDTRLELDETFTVELATPINATLADAVATGTILNDDPVPTISIDGVTAAEGDSGQTVFEFPVTLSQPSPAVVTVTYSTSDSSATAAGADYTPVTDTLSFNPGETDKAVNVAVHGDTALEADETFMVVLSSPANAVLGTAEAWGTILNDDEGGGGGGKPDWAPPSGLLNTMTVHAVVSLADGTYVEAAESMLAVFQGDAIRGVATIFDGPAAKMQFQLSVGSNLATESGLTLRVYDAATDRVYDVNEELVFVSDSTLGQIFAPQEFTADSGSVLPPAISVDDVTVSEGNSGQTLFRFTVRLDKASTQTITVDYATADGSATVAGNVYIPSGGQITFEPGETEHTLDVQVRGDLLVESDETFMLTLAAPVNAQLGDAEGVGTISNDDEGLPEAPPWSPPAGYLNTMTVHVSVRLPARDYVSAPGSLLAAFHGLEIRGVASIFDGPGGEMQFQLSVGSNFASESGFILKVYDAATGMVYDLDGTFDFAADATLGGIAAPDPVDAVEPLLGTWLFELDVTNGSEDRLGFGFRQGADDGIDQYDTTASDRGDGAGSALIREGQALVVENHAFDPQNPPEYSGWVLEIVADEALPTHVEWDAARAAEIGGGLMLIEMEPGPGREAPPPDGRFVAGGIRVDMTEETGITVPAGQTMYFRIVFGAVDQALSIAQGWNLVALPVEPRDNTPADVFDGNRRSERTVGPAWAFDSARARYYRAATVSALNGFWVYSEEASVINVAGFPVSDRNFPLRGAHTWHLLGVAQARPLDDSSRGTIPAYGWGPDQHAYVPIPQGGALDSGHAYWFYSASPAVLNPE
jgi:hypothetical protein